MKSFTRACLIFSGTVIAIGLVLTIIGGCLGAGSKFASMVNNGYFSWGGHNSIINTQDLQTRTEEFTDIDKLNIDLKYGELVIEKVEGNGYKVVAENVVDGYTCKNNNGELIIKDNIRNRFTFEFGDDIHPIVTVYIPENANFDKVTIEMGAGSVSVSDINSDDLGIDIGAGELKGNNINAKDTTLSVGAGNLEIDKFVTDTIDMECGTGKMEVSGSINGNADVECGLGNIVLSVTNNEQDYNYNLDCGIGNITVGEQSYGGVASEKTIDNNANNKMDVECGVGNIDIYFDKSI